MNLFFDKKIKDKRSSFTETTASDNSSTSLLNSVYSDRSLSEFDPCTVDEIRDIIRNSGIKVSPADIFPSKLLSNNIETLIPFITDLVNLSLSTGSIDGLKEAIV